VRVQWFSKDFDEIMEFQHKIEAHHGSIQCLAINKQGTLIATCSDKGTIIRVWNARSLDPEQLEKGEKQLAFEFRRGKQEATITSLTFDEEGKFLICASTKPTVHIFKVSKEGNTGSMFSMFSSIIPTAGDTWSFA